MTQPFSARNSFRNPEPPITIREDAPDDVRFGLLAVAVGLGLTPRPLRRLVCAVLRKREDPGNWSEYPNIHDEVERLVDEAPWFKVYDIAEKLYQHFGNSDWTVGQQFQSDFNEVLIDNGVGWQMKDGQVVVRGSADFNQSFNDTTAALEREGHFTSANEMREAHRDISRRPSADISGAVQHAMAALECLAREISGKNSKTLGQIIPELSLPKPLDEALQKLWGYASQRGRHISEGTSPAFEEAQLVVSVAGAVCSYLLVHNQ